MTVSGKKNNFSHIPLLFGLTCDCDSIVLNSHFFSGGGKGGTLHVKGQECSSEFLNLIRKGDQSRRGPGFFDP